MFATVIGRLRERRASVDVVELRVGTYWAVWSLKANREAERLVVFGRISDDVC